MLEFSKEFVCLFCWGVAILYHAYKAVGFDDRLFFTVITSLLRIRSVALYWELLGTRYFIFFAYHPQLKAKQSDACRGSQLLLTLSEWPMGHSWATCTFLPYIYQLPPQLKSCIWVYLPVPPHPCGVQWWKSSMLHSFCYLLRHRYSASGWR